MSSQDAILSLVHLQAIWLHCLSASADLLNAAHRKSTDRIWDHSGGGVEILAVKSMQEVVTDEEKTFTVCCMEVRGTAGRLINAK